MGFLRRNLRGSPRPLKQTSFVTLVRSLVEYSSVAWDPYLGKDRDTLERIQRRAARWINQDYATTSSVTEMLGALGLEMLAVRRRSTRITMMYKILHGYVGLTPKEIASFIHPHQGFIFLEAVPASHQDRRIAPLLHHTYHPRVE